MTALLRSRYFTWALLALPSLMMLKDYAAAGMTAHQLLHPSGEFGARAADDSKRFGAIIRERKISGD